LSIYCNILKSFRVKLSVRQNTQMFFHPFLHDSMFSVLFFSYCCVGSNCSYYIYLPMTLNLFSLGWSSKPAPNKFTVFSAVGFYRQWSLPIDKTSLQTVWWCPIL
jgi:hypothetical protein